MSEPKRPPRKGQHYLKVFFCHGCQSCWDVDPDTDTIQESEHVLGQEDVTAEIAQLREDLATRTMEVTLLRHETTEYAARWANSQHEIERLNATVAELRAEIAFLRRQGTLPLDPTP